MKVKILGSGCANCNKLEKNTIDALKDLNIDYEIEHVKDYEKIMGYGVMKTPALVVDEKVIISGRVSKKDEIKNLIKNYS
ncbi:small redox-active disulfide protein 2 [Oceanotoga teriensis]|jgi:small redox-active disulfide protein 2|uniref:Small redox-active disulfide protein 2 n=1 Tax=Oceanotoga teriensis TaxID=515440 RepID=A0AA45C6G0_9BACT|nr:thioredoxin family protein [Oceanotoga teriensis]PWJ92067.1 small redox-active disulfide protein 2 [Oceanotoga teriensis]